MNPQSMLLAATRYKGLGLVVTPLNGKVPIVKDWQDLTREQGFQAVRLRGSRLGNIGIVAGQNSGNLFQLEIDGLDLYQSAIDAIPELRTTWAVLSGSGNGVHIYGRAVELPPTTRADKGEHREIRFKGQGQQCVAPPSIHPDTHQTYKTHVSAPIRTFDQFVIDAVIAFVEAHKPTPVRQNSDERRDAVVIPTVFGSKRAYALKALDNLVAEVARLSSAENDPQNDTMHKNVVKLAAFAQRGDLYYQEVFDEMENAMRSNGYIGGYASYHQFEASFDSGWNYGISNNNYVPQCYQLPAQPTRTWLSDRAVEKLERKQAGVPRPDLDFIEFAESLGAVVRSI